MPPTGKQKERRVLGPDKRHSAVLGRCPEWKTARGEFSYGKKPVRLEQQHEVLWKGDPDRNPLSESFSAGKTLPPPENSAAGETLPARQRRPVQEELSRHDSRQNHGQPRESAARLWTGITGFSFMAFHFPSARGRQGAESNLTLAPLRQTSFAATPGKSGSHDASGSFALNSSQLQVRSSTLPPERRTPIRQGSQEIASLNKETRKPGGGSKACSRSHGFLIEF